MHGVVDWRRIAVPGVCSARQTIQKVSSHTNNFVAMPVAACGIVRRGDAPPGKSRRTKASPSQSRRLPPGPLRLAATSRVERPSSSLVATCAHSARLMDRPGIQGNRAPIPEVAMLDALIRQAEQLGLGSNAKRFIGLLVDAIFSGRPGGFSGFAQRFEQAGLGSLLQSWIGGTPGDNALAPDQFNAGFRPAVRSAASPMRWAYPRPPSAWPAPPSCPN